MSGHYSGLFSPHPSANLEYWYFKVNCGSVALLVDWIDKRVQGEHWLRVSIHAPGRREVLFHQLDSVMPEDIFLLADKTIGHLGDIAWNLNIDLGSERIRPDVFPAALLQMPDLLSISAPYVMFTGHINTGSETIIVNNVPGMVSHYWGRKLASEWWWISAHQFDQPEVAVECVVLKSGLWGMTIPVSIAYLYLKDGHGSRFNTVPFNLARAEGTPERFTVNVRPIGQEPITLKCTGYEYGNFGDNIINTLVGDLEVWRENRCIGTAKGTAGLERLAPR